MLNKIEGSYSPGEKADIAYLLMAADQKKSESFWDRTLFQFIQPKFGIYFSEIENICREYELTMHFLAVPAFKSLERHHEYLVVDPNKKGLFCPFLAYGCSGGFDQLLSYANEWEISYDKNVNLNNLEKGGVYKSSSLLLPKWNMVYHFN